MCFLEIHEIVARDIRITLPMTFQAHTWKQNYIHLNHFEFSIRGCIYQYQSINRYLRDRTCEFPNNFSMSKENQYIILVGWFYLKIQLLWLVHSGFTLQKIFIYFCFLYDSIVDYVWLFILSWDWYKDAQLGLSAGD